MKTTELYVEQVFIGSLVIVIMVLPWSCELSDKLRVLGSFGSVASGTLALGLAFWLGIPFDRLADTLSERLERHNRLRFALKVAVDKTLPHKLGAHKLDLDLFPEDRYRLAALRDSEAVANWIDYHRSRIRLTRALALYGPALTLTLTVAVYRSELVCSGPPIYSWLAGLGLLYSCWAFLARFGPEIPRTDEPKFLDYATRWGSVNAAAQLIQKSEIKDYWIWLSEWRILAVPVLLLVTALSLGIDSRKHIVQMAAVTGAVLTTVSAWSWWRISFTYRSYLLDLFRHTK